MDDKAVAPVVALMLILAILVTFISIYNNTYVPSMKEEVEITHIHGVEESFLRFSSDLENAVSLKGSMKLSEPIRLGGGDVLFNTLKSGGLLQVCPDSDWITIICNGTSYQGGMVNFSYQPTGNFWQDQGYVWRWGYVNVTCHDDETPLQYCTMKEVTDPGKSSVYGFTSALLQVESTGDNEIRVSFANLKPDHKRSYFSGNGMAKLELNSSTAEKEITGVSNITLLPDSKSPLHLWIRGICNDTLSSPASYDYESGKLDFGRAVNVTLRLTNVTVRAC